MSSLFLSHPLSRKYFPEDPVSDLFPVFHTCRSTRILYHTGVRSHFGVLSRVLSYDLVFLHTRTPRTYTRHRVSHESSYLLTFF